MPELPDVEAFRRHLEQTSLHKPIQDVLIPAPVLLQDQWPDEFREQLLGQRFVHSHRHGKYLFLALERGGALALHLGLTGSLHPLPPKEDAPAYTRLLFRFRDGSALAFRDPRKLGRVRLVDNEQAFVRQKGLGLDGLDPALDIERFQQLLDHGHGAIKCWLMDQSVIAGIGNEYSDEILFQAAIHPKRQLPSLGAAERRKLFNTTKHVLETAVSHHADLAALRGFLLNQRKANAPCPRCGGNVAKLRACGRTAYYCPACQDEA